MKLQPIETSTKSGSETLGIPLVSATHCLVDSDFYPSKGRYGKKLYPQHVPP